MSVQGFRPSAATKVSVVVVEILFWLAVLAVLLSVVLVIAVNFTPFHVKYTRAPLEVCYQSGGGGWQKGQDLSITSSKITGFSQLVMENGEKGLQRIFVVMPLLLSMLFLGIMMILRKIIKSIRSGTPFTRENAARIRAMGWLVMAAGPFYGILEYIYAWVWLPKVKIEGALVEINPDLRVFYIFAGLVIVVIGHVFQYGVSLREDSELTV